jgi:hypothetical protein
MELIKTDKEVQLETELATLQSQFASISNQYERASAQIRTYQHQHASVEKYLSEYYDHDTEEHFTAIAEMLEINLLKEYELQVTFTCTVKVTAPVDWNREFDDAFDVTVDSNECEMDINDYTVDSAEVSW